MKQLFTIIILPLTCLVSLAKDSYLVDVINNDTLFYKQSGDDAFINKYVDRFKDINSSIFKLSNSIEHDRMRENLTDYFNAFNESDSLLSLLNHEHNAVRAIMDQPSHIQVMPSFSVSQIALIPLSYYNKHISFEYRIQYKKDISGKRSQDYLRYYFVYDLRTGAIYNQQDLNKTTDVKKLFGALRKKWSILTNQIDLKTESHYLDKLFLKEENQMNDSIHKSIVLAKVSKALDTPDLNKIKFYWSGSGVMVTLKDVLFSYKQKRFSSVNIHLDIHEIPKSCFKHIAFPNKLPKTFKEEDVYNFESLSNFLDINIYFKKHHINLLEVQNKDLTKMEMTFMKSTDAEEQYRGEWLYKDGQLTEYIYNPNDSKYVVDSLIWHKRDLLGFHRSKKINGKLQRISTVCLVKDKHNNSLSKIRSEDNIFVKHNVYMGKYIACIKYNVFEEYDESEVVLSWYNKSTKGWIYTTWLGEKQPYICKENGPHVIGDRTLIYNKDKQIVQDWYGRYTFTLYHYDKQGRLNELSKSSSGTSKTHYTYLYDERSNLVEIKKTSDNRKISYYLLKWK